MNSLNYLIAGGTGFIGSNIANYLARTGTGNVTFVSRNKTLKKNLQNSGKCLTWQELESRGIPEDTDVVMCLTGNNCFYPFSKFLKRNLIEEARESRVIPTQKLAKLIKQSQKPPKLFISASAISHYPVEKSFENYFFSDYEKYTETKGFLAEITQDVEKACKFSQGFKTRSIMPRFGIVLGREAPFVKINKLMYVLQMGMSLGKQDSFFHWIHIDDVVNALMYLIHLNLHVEDKSPKLKSITGPVNFVTLPNATSTNQYFFDNFGWPMGRETLFNLPPNFLELFFNKDVVDQFQQDNQIYPEKLIDSGYEFKYSSADEAIEECLS